MAEVFTPQRAPVARGREDLLRMPPGVVSGMAAAGLGLVVSFWFWFTIEDFDDTGRIYMGMAFLAMIGYAVFWGATRPIRVGDRLPLWPGFTRDGIGDDILLGIALGVVFVLLSGVSLATGAEAALPLPPFASELAGQSRFIAVVVLAPLIEEVFMRGWLYGMIANLFRGPGRVEPGVGRGEIAASIVTAIVFSIFHVAAYGTGLTTAFFTVAMFGFAAGILNARGGARGEGTLWAGWVGHTIYNGTIYGLAFGVGVQFG